MADRIQAPDLPELEPRELVDGPLDLSGALVASGVVRAQRVKITESELRGVVIEAPDALGLTLVDVVLRDCGLANVDAPEATIRRVAAHQCRLVGLGLGEAQVSDLRVTSSSLELASFAGARLRDVAFEDVKLGEASFQEARLERVEFIGCDLAGADFRGARCTGCAIRGSGLNAVVGIEALRGVRMPWGDIVASAAALASVLGIEIDEEN